LGDVRSGVLFVYIEKLKRRQIMNENCGTGCTDPKHMLECPNCGAKYHFGLTHCCPTSAPMFSLPPKPNVSVGIWKKRAILSMPIHYHTAQFGSELWCPECNPVCADKHGPTKLSWCGHPDCPMNPKNFSKSPVLLTTPFNVDPENKFCSEEEYEDKLRIRKRKSVRIQGKYKGRGKTKRREP
jgi:hypothetical protein